MEEEAEDRDVVVEVEVEAVAEVVVVVEEIVAEEVVEEEEGEVVITIVDFFFLHWWYSYGEIKKREKAPTTGITKKKQKMLEKWPEILLMVWITTPLLIIR